MDVLVTVSITQPDDSVTTFTVDVTGVSTRTEAYDAARSVVQNYRHKYIQGGDRGAREKALTTIERSRDGFAV